VTPYYLNLEKEEVFYKAEAGFISFIVFPLWELLDLYLEGEIEDQVSSITKTKERYERLKEYDEQNERSSPCKLEETLSFKNNRLFSFSHMLLIHFPGFLVCLQVDHKAKTHSVSRNIHLLSVSMCLFFF
jgi:hypothetical protein